MSNRPKIGISLDYIDVNNEPEGTWYNKYDWYGLRHHYNDVITNSGGAPIPLSYNNELIKFYVQELDGLLLTGSDSDIDPQLYGEEIHYSRDVSFLRPKRTNFEMAIAKAFLKANKPVLGICAGMQLISVIHGCTLYQYIPKEFNTSINHNQSLPITKLAHSISIKEDTLLSTIIPQKLINVNSHHHQAVKNLGKDVIVNAIAEDGLIEGIEIPRYDFCLGVQWHPEIPPISEHNQNIFTSFINACNNTTSS